MTTDADRVARERLAREARETASTLLDWVGTRVDARPDGTRPRQSAGPCTWCPVCALVAALRGEQPELTATLAEQASGLLVLLRLLVQAHATGAHEHHAPASPATPTAGPEPEPAAPTEPVTPPGWPAEWGTPTWQTDVPWDVAPHAVFDPEPAGPTARTVREPADDDARPAPERPTGRRGPRPTPRWTPAAADAPVPTPTAPVTTAADAPAPAPAHGTRPAVGNAPDRSRRGVQRIPVRRRPRPC